MYGRLLPLELALLLAVLVLFLTAACLPRGRMKAWLGLIAGLFSAALLTIVGPATYYFATHSPRIVVTGTVTDLLVVHGRHPHSSFYLTRPDSSSTKRLLASYDGSKIHEGEKARVTYLGWGNQILRIEGLDGPDSGWVRDEGDGSITGILLGIAAAPVTFFSVRSFRKHPDGYRPERLHLS